MHWQKAVFVAAMLASSIGYSSVDDPQYMDALNAESSGDYPLAANLYREYLSSNPQSQLTSRVGTKLSVLGEALRLGVDDSLELFLRALNARDERRVEDAEANLAELRIRFPDSYLVDDALYLSGYINLMDTYNFEAAHLSMRQLQMEYPDSTYMDTALYSEAIALEQLGNTNGAYDRFSVLRERHTQFALSLFGTNWPKSTYLSRYWFDRADNRLKMLDERQQGAAKLVARESSTSNNYDMRVEVMIEGQQLALLLSPSPLLEGTHFLDDDAKELELVDTRLYAGEVENIRDSWVRVMIRGQSIEGVVKTPSQHFDLEPDTMIGTIDYYQARKSSKPGDASFELQDYALHPPPDFEARLRQNPPEPALGAASADSALKLLRMDIVVDSQYDDYYGGNGLIEAMSNLNVADGIYRENFGLAIEVGNATVFGQRTADPMNLGAVTLETMLRAFRDYKQSGGNSADIGLTYLFSGNRNIDEAIGLAWIGAVCRSDGFDVGVTTPTSYGDLLITHELGHSMGAQHDTDTSCSRDVNKLMWPRISATTNQEFSSCSSQTVSTGINKSCLQNTIDVSLKLHSNGAAGFEAEVINQDTYQSAAGASLVLDVAALDLNQLPQNCVDNSASQVLCNIGVLQPGETQSFSFQLSVNSPESSLIATLKPTGFFDVQRNNNVARLDFERTAGGDAVWASLAEDTTNGISAGGQSIQSTSTNSGSVTGNVSGSASGSGGGAPVWLLASSLLSVGFRMLAR